MPADTYDVVVVGNGVIGLSVARALSLRDPTCSVALVGPKERPGAATKASGAMLGTFGEVTALTQRSPIWRKKLEEGLEATARWAPWRSAINDDLGDLPSLPAHSGTFIITNSKSGASEDASFSSIAAVMRELNEPFDEVDPHDIPGMDPLPGSRPSRALYIPGEGWQLSGPLLDALEVVNRHRGVDLIDATAGSIRVAGGGFQVDLRERGQTLSTGQVVLAAGAYCQELLQQFPDVARRVPHVLAGVGTSLVVSHAQPIFDAVVRTPNRAGGCGLHAIPMPGGTFLGAANHLQASPETKPKVRFLTHLLRTGMEQLNAFLDECYIEEVRAGDRPVSLDAMPLVGETSIPGLWLATGTYRDGVHLSPLLAESLASEMLGGDRLMASEFRPERAPISVLPPAEVAPTAAANLLDAYSEYSVMLPPLLVELTEHALDELSEVTYQRLGVEFGMHPDVYITLLFNPRQLSDVRRWLEQADPTLVSSS